MEFINIPSHERGEIAFEGERLAEIDERAYCAQAGNWFEIGLYRTRGGGYVLASTFRTSEPCADALSTTLRFATPGDLLDYLGCDKEPPTLLVRELLGQAAQDSLRSGICAHPASGFIPERRGRPRV